MPHPMPRSCVVLIAALTVAGFLLSIRAAAQSEPTLEEALVEFRAGKYSSAAAKFAAVEAALPGATDALLFQTKCLVHLEDFGGAEVALRKYLGSHRDSADAMYLLGFVLHRQNRPAESLETYTRAAALIRPTSDDLKIVGLDYVLLNDYADAIKWLEKAVEFDPRNEDAWYYLGRAYYTEARLPEARAAFARVLEIDPHDARAENNLGLILETEGQPAAAIDAYRKAITWQEDNFHPSEQPYVNLGNLLMEQGQTKEAIAPLEEAVALAPGNAFCHLTLGVYYRKIGRMDGAQRELERATQLDPENAVAHYQLGRTYKQMNSLDRAQAEFARTSELQSRAAASKHALPNR